MLDYRVRWQGTWGRNRSVKRDSHALVENCPAETPLDDAEVVRRAEAYLHTIKAKPGLVYEVAAYPCTLERRTSYDGVEYHSKLHVLMSDRVIARGKIGG